MPDRNWNEDFIKKIIDWKLKLDAANADSGAQKERAFWRSKLDSVKSQAYLDEAERRIGEKISRERQMSLVPKQEATKQIISEQMTSNENVSTEKTPAKATMTSSSGKPEEAKKKDDDNDKKPPSPPTSGLMRGFDESKFGNVKNPKSFQETDSDRTALEQQKFDAFMKAKSQMLGLEGAETPEQALAGLGVLGAGAATALAPEAVAAASPAIIKFFEGAVGKAFLQGLMSSPK